ncbi:MAG: pilin [bacterium]|nr:pilin [bacterium]
MDNRQFTMHKKTIPLLFIVYCLLFIGIPTFAQTDYKLLAPIPLSGVGAAPTETTVAGPYIKGIFTLIIAIAGGLAVVKIIFGGIQYMSTDAFEGKSEAKTTIQNAIWGLLLVIGAWLILYTINPKLVEFNLSIPIQESATVTPSPVVSSSGCPTCVVVSVPHKSAPLGCAPPGPCTVDPALNSKLVALHQLNNLIVNESYPPTKSHADPCHNNGTCADVGMGAAKTPPNIQKFINDSTTVGLRSVFEVKDEARASQIRSVSGLSTSQVIVVPTINGEHFSVYMN